MLADQKRKSGRDSGILAYWANLSGDPKDEREKLMSISPSEHADAFRARVLLIHRRDDTVVSYVQSELMVERALRNAGKEMTLVKLRGEDHWLSGSETRLATLRELDLFINKHIGKVNQP